MEHAIKVDKKDHALDGQSKMNSFRKEKKHCDFIIKVESVEIAVHRAVICSRSDYFDAMFSHDTKEKRTGVAEIKGVDRECTVKCVDFMYTGETSILGDKCGELMHVATLFQLLTLCNAIAAFLEEKLDCKSFFATKQLADLFGCQKLVNACNEFALKHFHEIAQLEEFKQLDKEYIESLIESKCNKTDESDKCKSVVEWIKHDFEGRKIFLVGLTGKLDLTRVHPTYRRFLLENEPLVYSSAECSRSIGISFAKSMKMTAKDKVLGVGAETDKGIAVFDNKSGRMQVFDTNEKTLTQKQAFSDDMTKNVFSAVVLEEHLYVFLNNKNVYRIVYSDPYSRWEKMTSTNLAYGCVVVLNGMIYTLDYDDYTNSMERFDPSLNKWQILPNKTLNVLGAPLAVAEGKIFAVSGCDTSGRYRTEVEKFDPAISSWALDVSLSRARYYSSAATADNRIYVLGGFDATNKIMSAVEYRCARSKTWITITPMKYRRSSFSACCIDEKIYAIGGDGRNPKTIEEFDPQKNEWKVVCWMSGMDIRPLASVVLPL